jgi:hypothetical protein
MTAITHPLVFCVFTQAAASSIVALAFGPREALPVLKRTVTVFMESKSSSPLMRLFA